jgi:phage baseplate assembly protein W
MADLYHDIGGDLVLGPTGDIATASADLETKQRILRRLISVQGTYIWQLNYGAGLPQFIGQPTNPGAIEAIISAQVALEATVATSPAPVVTVASDNTGTAVANISYVDATTGQTQTLTCPLGT